MSNLHSIILVTSLASSVFDLILKILVTRREIWIVRPRSKSNDSHLGVELDSLTAKLDEMVYFHYSNLNMMVMFFGGYNHFRRN